MKLTLRRWNDFLTVVVIGLGLYIITTPFIPQVTYVFRDTDPEVVAPYAGALADKEGSSGEAPLPEDNRIVIPSISLNEPIKSGANIWVINDGGTWHRPATSNPNQGGNSVIVGHRFYGGEASTFYHLDKVAVGDRVATYWEGKETVYEVEEIKVVEAAQTEIEAPTADDHLTLYTCTPLWTATQRLVVIAKPIDVDAIEEQTI